MLFNSIHFTIFFLVVTSLFFGLPHRFRWQMLLAASCWFYMAFVPVYILILGFTIVVDYFAGIAIEDTAEPRRRKWFLVASIVANVGVLAFFKYYNFLNENLTAMLGLGHFRNPVPFLNIILPIGLSFHTFQAMSYTIEVYRGRQAAERHFGIYALYVMYYPQLVMGPIERPGNLLHQLREPHSFDADRVREGLKLMLWGFFKKLVIADRLAPFVSQVYNDPSKYEGVPVLLVMAFFIFQVYADFSGYSDISVGAAQVMGVTLMRNFARPFLSDSMADLWRRWHVSLSSWFRDYVYFPLGGSRKGLARQVFNILLVFFISGLWHGPTWGYVLFGTIQGVYLAVEILASRAAARVTGPAWLISAVKALAPLRVPFVFAEFCFAGVYFRARTISEAFALQGSAFTGLWDSLGRLGSREYLKANVLMGQGPTEFVIAMGAIALLLGVQLLQERGSMRARLSTYPAPVRYAVYYATIIATLFFGAFNSTQQFIYFQF